MLANAVTGIDNRHGGDICGLLGTSLLRVPHHNHVRVALKASDCRCKISGV
jgi:hypothetical protein